MVKWFSFCGKSFKKHFILSFLKTISIEFEKISVSLSSEERYVDVNHLVKEKPSVHEGF
jgi:hypothetical protein